MDIKMKKRLLIIEDDEEEFEIKQDTTLGIEKFKQSQSHGLFWDSEIREKVFGLSPCINDTTKYDISCDQNKFDDCENISIKTSGNNNIDCGDILRFYEIESNKKLTIILIRYKQMCDKKLIEEIIEIDYNDKFKNILFGSIPKSVLEGYVSFIKSIGPGIVSNEIKKKYKDCKIEMQKKFNMYINISPKVDSKNQRRVQCSIPKVNELLDKYPEFIISRNKESIIRGISITSCLQSGPRIRNTK